MSDDKKDAKIIIGFYRDGQGDIYPTLCSDMNGDPKILYSFTRGVFHKAEVTIPWYVFKNNKLDLSKPLQVRKNSHNLENWRDIERFEISAEGLFHFDNDCLTSFEIENFVRNKPEPSCDGKVVEIDGKKYKLTEIE